MGGSGGKAQISSLCAWARYLLKKGFFFMWRQPPEGEKEEEKEEKEGEKEEKKRRKREKIAPAGRVEQKIGARRAP